MAGVWHDDGVYMLIARALANGSGLVYEGVVGTPPAAKFPPLYPVSLAVLWTVFGSIGAVTLAATFLNLGFLAASAALLAKVLNESTELPRTLCILVAAVGFASSDVLRTALVALSEPLFMVLTTLGLLLWSRSRDEEGALKGRVAVALSAVLVLAVATRTAALALVLAIALGSLTRRVAAVDAPSRPTDRRFAEAALLAGPALVFAFGWSRWSASAARDITSAARDLLGPYGDWLADQTLAAPMAFVTNLPGHASGVLGRAAALLFPGLTGAPLWVAAGLVTPICVWGLVRLRQRLPVLTWFVLGYLAMLLLWPYLDRRLLTPLHPALVSAIVVGGHDLFRRATLPAVRQALTAGGVLWVLAFSSVTAFRIADGWPTAPYRLRADRLAASVEALRRTVPRDAVVGAPEFWAALHLHGGWMVAPSVRFDPRSTDPDAPMWGTADEQIALWRALGIDHLLLEQAGRLHGAALDQLEAACPGTVFVLATFASSIIVRVDWSACPEEPAPSG